MKKKMVVVALLGAALCGSSWSATKGANAFHTKASLVADVASIRPGKTFTVGVLLTMDPGWHTYWKNGGDAGLPTRIRWDLPPGFTVGEIEWPVPEKHLESGDLLTYGYSRETMLLVSVAPPPGLRTGSTVTLKASVHWLECEHLCVPGNADVRLDLPVSQNDPAPSHAALFERYRSLVPGRSALPPAWRSEQKPVPTPCVSISRSSRPEHFLQEPFRISIPNPRRNSRPGAPARQHRRAKRCSPFPCMPPSG